MLVVEGYTVAMGSSKKPKKSAGDIPGHAADPFALVSKIKTRGPAPVHLWNPPFCGDIDMQILRDGTWLHEGKPIRRKAMVQLFASILSREDDGDYYLVTPVEKVRIQVQDCPFIVVLMENKGESETQQISFITNLDESFILDSDHPLRVTTDPDTDEPHPVVHVRSGLNGLLGRNVFYQLVELAVRHEVAGKSVTGVWSAGSFFPLE